MSQSSGMFPQLSDGTRKTVVGGKPPARTVSKPPAPLTPKDLTPRSAHRRGGFAKHKGK